MTGDPSTTGTGSGSGAGGATASETGIGSGILSVADADLDRCVACGLCLPACPTWRVSGREAASPRGRIAAMRAVQWDGHPLDAAFATMMDECVQCRGCEPICPAFVPFGRLMEGAREALRTTRTRRSLLRRVAEWLGYRLLLPRRRALLAATWVLWALQRLRLAPRAVPRLRARSLLAPLRPSRPPRSRPSDPTGDPVVLFPGCVMDAWMRDVHRDAVRLVEAAGGWVQLPGRSASCCGALHLHAGRRSEARALAARVVAATPPEGDVLVDSAGCGAALRDYGDLLGTPEARAFAERVRDVHEWLATRPLPGLRHTGRALVVQDPCHLRHVQRVDGPVRELLARAYEVATTDDDGLCCGAGGAYSLLERRLASQVRARKAEALRRAGQGGDPLVASANPGCSMHLAAAGLRVRHPVELLADALDGDNERSST